MAATDVLMAAADEGGMARRTSDIADVRVGDHLEGQGGSALWFSGKAVLTWAAAVGDECSRIVVVELDDAEGLGPRKGKSKKKTVIVLTEDDGNEVRRTASGKPLEVIIRRTAPLGHRSRRGTS